jgi:hypothetical protein
MPGAGSYASLNFLAERAIPDGLTIVYNPFHPLGQAYGESGLRTRYENFEFLGGMGDPHQLRAHRRGARRRQAERHHEGRQSHRRRELSWHYGFLGLARLALAQGSASSTG